MEATNAWQSLAALQQPVDLVILDVRVPYDISGNDLIHTLKDLGNGVPIIVFSGWTEDLDDELPLREGRLGEAGARREACRDDQRRPRESGGELDCQAGVQQFGLHAP